MYDSYIRVNTVSGNTSGLVQIGVAATTWVDEDGVVSWDQIDIFGNLTTTGRLRFKGCFDPDDGTYTMECYKIHGTLSGQVIESFCPSATVDVNICQ